MNEEKKKYSSTELAEFKAVITEKLDKAQKDYDLLKNTFTQSDENDIQDTSPSFKIMDEGASVMSKEEIGKLAERQQKFIQHLKSALVRIENKTYGVCRITGKLIQKERLMAVPHATLSMEAKLNQKD